MCRGVAPGEFTVKARLAPYGCRMNGTPFETPSTPEFRALTIVTSALASTLAKADGNLLAVFIVSLQAVAEDLEEDDPALQWVRSISSQLLRSYPAT